MKSRQHSPKDHIGAIGMARCRLCGTWRGRAEKFCACCGEPFERRCPACGNTDDNSAALYCTDCGTEYEKDTRND